MSEFNLWAKQFNWKTNNITNELEHIFNEDGNRVISEVTNSRHRREKRQRPLKIKQPRIKPDRSMNSQCSQHLQNSTPVEGTGTHGE
jgi:hypothetical protein